MDVLQLIKMDHSEILRSVDMLHEDWSNFSQVVDGVYSRIELHFNIEKEYLYPELLILSGDSNKFVNRSLCTQEQVMQALESLKRALSDGANEMSIPLLIRNFQTGIREHFSYEEECMLPRIRKGIFTPEREELGEVIQDFKVEWMKNHSEKTPRDYGYDGEIISQV